MPVQCNDEVLAPVSTLAFMPWRAKSGNDIVTSLPISFAFIDEADSVCSSVGGVPKLSCDIIVPAINEPIIPITIKSFFRRIFPLYCSCEAACSFVKGSYLPLVKNIGSRKPKQQPVGVAGASQTLQILQTS